MIKRIEPYVAEGTLNIMLKSNAQYHLNYPTICNSTGVSLVNKIQNFRIITGSSYDVQCRVLLGWDGFKTRRTKHNARLMFRVYQNQCSQYLIFFSQRVLPTTKEHFVLHKKIESGKKV